MAKDKYKIRLSENVFYTLRDDMRRFNFLKQNGDVNQNNFYNKLILGLYNNLKDRQEILNNYLKDNLSKYIKEKDKLLSFCKQINSKINELYYSDFKSNYHFHEIYIYPTKETISMYDDIENNDLINQSMSEFIRNLINEYVTSPFFERERLLYLNNFNKIIEAINEQKLILIKNNKNYEIIMQPYDIIPSIEDTYNYIVGKKINARNSANFSIKLSRIKSIIILDNYFSFSKEDIENFDYQLKDGPEFLCDETKHVVIKLSNDGIKKFDSCYKDRPVPTDFDVRTGIYTFDTDLNKLYLYLLQFGRHVKILEPLELKNKLNKFHKTAIDE